MNEVSFPAVSQVTKSPNSVNTVNELHKVSDELNACDKMNRPKFKNNCTRNDSCENLNNCANKDVRSAVKISEMGNNKCGNVDSSSNVIGNKDKNTVNDQTTNNDTEFIDRRMNTM